MAEEERRILSDRGPRNYKNSPLLSSTRKNYASEKSSLSDSFEAPKSYGTTRNPLQPQCKVKLIGHVLETTDTLQGLAIKYGVTVEQLRRANKLWANDNIHLLKILKVPVDIDSQYYSEYVELSGEGSGTDDSVNEDKISSNVGASETGIKEEMPSEQSVEKSNEMSSEEENKGSAVNFLEQLDARIKSSKQESEKLRTLSGPKIIAEVEKSSLTSFGEDEDLFRPLSSESSRSHRGQRLTQGKHRRRGQSAQQNEEEDDQFFEL